MRNRLMGRADNAVAIVMAPSPHSKPQQAAEGGRQQPIERSLEYLNNRLTHRADLVGRYRQRGSELQDIWLILAKPHQDREPGMTQHAQQVEQEEALAQPTPGPATC